MGARTRPATFACLSRVPGCRDEGAWLWRTSLFILDFVASVLRAEGCEVTTVSDGEQGLGGPGKRFDLLVLDTNLPRLSGAQVLARLRESRSDLAVIMMSGETGPRIVPGESGSRLLAKPFDAQALLEAVEQA